MQGGTQLGLFNEAEAEQDHKAVEPTENTIVIPEHTRKAKRTVDELTANLPVKEVLITLSDDELICDKCGGKYEMIGKKLVPGDWKSSPVNAMWWNITAAAMRARAERRRPAMPTSLRR